MEVPFLKKDKKNSPIIIVVIMFFFVFAVIYCIISFIGSFFDRPDVYYKSTIEQNIENYEKVYDNNFYILDNKVANFLEAVDKQMYSRLYSILATNYDKIYSRGEVVNTLKNYRENVFNYNDGKTHQYKGHLLNAYNLRNGMYLLQLDFDDNNFYLIIGSGQKNYTYTFVE